jgi:hypothetical protein
MLDYMDTVDKKLQRCERAILASLTTLIFTLGVTLILWVQLVLHAKKRFPPCVRNTDHAL